MKIMTKKQLLDRVARQDERVFRRRAMRVRTARITLFSFEEADPEEKAIDDKLIKNAQRR